MVGDHETRRARRRRQVRVVGIGMLALAGLVAAPAGGAQNGLGGYATQARSSVVNLTYASPGLLPTGAVILQGSIPESLTTLDSGVGYALSSTVWPGPVLADLGTIAEYTSPPGQQPPNVPPYPVRSESRYPQGPGDRVVEPVPGARMSTHAEDGATEAASSLSHLELPLVFDVAGVESWASTTTDGTVATARSRTALQDIVLLGGLLTIESLQTTLEASTDGVTATSSATTDVGRVTFAGVEATIDRDGIHLAESESDGPDQLDPVIDELPADQVVEGGSQVTDPASEAFVAAVQELQGGLDQFAEQSGIRIRLAPDDLVQEGGLAEAFAGGILIELYYDGDETPIISDVIDQIPFEEIPGDYDVLPPDVPRPPFTPQAIARMVEETHIFTITLGNGFVSVNGTEGFSFQPSAPSVGGFAPSGTVGSGSGASPGLVTAPAGTAPPPPPAAAPPAVAAAGPSPIAAVRGLPNTWAAGLAVLGLAFLAASGGRRLAARALVSATSPRSTP